MAERFWGRIEIGGTLPAAQLLHFCLVTGIRQEELEKYVKDDHFVLEDSECAYGAFEDLESLCEVLELCYIRRSDGKYEYSPEIVFYTPEMNEIGNVILDHSGNMQVPMDELRNVQAALDAEDVELAQRLLDPLIVDLPELPPFTVGK